MKRLLGILLICALTLAVWAAALGEDLEAEPTPVYGAVVIDVNLRLEDGSLQEVALQRIGSVACWVWQPRVGEVYVPTADMTWDTNADEAHRTAYIWAPNTGEATLRLSEKPKSAIVKKVSGGSCCLVFDYEEGRKYTGVYCEGKSGYVLTSALRFLDRSAPFATGVTSYKGSTAGTTKISLRMEPSQASRTWVKLKQGLPVWVLREEAGYYLVDCNGYHGYVRKQYLTLDEGQTAPTPTPRP